MSEARKGKTPWNKGKKMSEEFIKKNIESHKGQVAWNKGKKMSEEQKKKFSEAKKGYIPWNKGQKGLLHWKLVDGKRFYYKEK